MVATNKIKFFILLFSALCLQLNAQQHYSIQIPEQQALSESYVYSFLQDNRGYLWIGTSEGLYNYDGHVFEQFSVQDSLAENFITCGLPSGNGIWFGHMNGNLSFFNGSKFEKRVPANEEKSSITAIHSSSGGKVWAGTISNGLLNLNNFESKNEQPLSSNQITITAFQFVAENSLLIGSVDGLRYCRLAQDGKIEILQYFNEVPRTKIQSISLKNDSSGFYITTNNEGIFHLAVNEGQFIIQQILKGNPELTESLQCFLEDSKGNFWLGTFGNGLYRISPDKNLQAASVLHFGSRQGLIAENIKTIFQDRDENIWIGTFGNGIVKISSQPFSTFIPDTGVKEMKVKALFASQDFKWIATDEYVLKVDNKNSSILKRYIVPHESADGEVNTIFVENNGQLWVGTNQSGLFHLNEKSDLLKAFPIHDGILENHITSITGTGNNLWVGTKKGLCRIDLVTNSKEWFTIQTGGLPHNAVNSLQIDSENKIWVATQSRTMLCIDGKNTKKISIPSTYSSATLVSTALDNKGRIWVGSSGGGIFLILHDSVLNLSSREGLYSDFCYGMAGDQDGYLWVSHQGGISRINTNDLTIKSIQKYAGIENDYEFYSKALIAGNSGIVWFGYNKGIIVYDHHYENISMPAPLIRINSVYANNKELDIRKRIKLAPGRYKIQFDFTGISLREPDLVRYQYRLKGYDEDWSEITTEHTATYTGIENGTYVFEVNASSSDGIITKQPAQIEIVIHASPWRSAWTYLILTALISLLIFLWIKRRDYKYSIEKQVLEKKVLERTVEIQRQKDELEMQRDLINRKNKDITDSLKYARRIQSAITPPEELLQKLLPEHFIINKPKDIVSGDFCWYTQSNDKIIITVADCTGHGVPGAIMSILGINSLNEIVVNYGITEPARILELLRLKVITALSQQGKDSPTFDGINLGLCAIDLKTLNIQFSGAINNMVHIHEGKLNIIKADRIPIGASDNEHDPFTQNDFQGSKGDIIYLFSDGYQDQFGGHNDKKFSSRRLFETLDCVHNLEMKQQKTELEIILKKWMGNIEQTDDITILGFKL